MDVPPEPPAAPRDFFVLVEGQMHGPFTVESLRAAFESGELTAQDFVQVGGLPIWRPLAQVLNSPTPSELPPPPPPPVEVPAVAPEVEEVQGGPEAEIVEDEVVAEDNEPEAVGFAPAYGGTSTWPALLAPIKDRLREDFDTGAVKTGAICLGVGVVACLAARWPFLFWLPWFGLAFFAGFGALKRGKTMPGVCLLVGACAFPILFTMVLPVHRPPRVVPLEDESYPDSASAIGGNATNNSPSAPVPSKPEPARQQSVPMVIDSVVKPKAAPATPAPATPAPVKQTSPATPPPAPKQSNAISQPQPVIAAAPPPVIPSTKAVEPLPPLDFSSPKPNNAIIGGDLVQAHRDCLVVVKDGSASGSGFVCRDGQKTWLVTNAHVAAGMRNPQFSRLDGSLVRVSTPEAGGPRDVIRFNVAEQGQPLEILQNLEATTRIGDAVVVLGNSGGGGVVTSLSGKLVGIGPDRIEVSAEFIPGNSGSPIIHVPTGKVIGIATYLTRRYDDFSVEKPGSTDPAPTIRRFGYRLDRIERWEPVNWAKFHAEAEQIRKISALTADVFDFIDALRRREDPEFGTDTLRRPATEWLTNIRRPQVSSVDRNRSTQNFLSNLRFMVRSDVTIAETQIGYGFFREQLRKEREVRDRLFKAFDDEVKVMTSPTMR